MRIIPAIDIINGQCVRLTKGDYSTKKVYDSNPLEVAKSFEDAGLKHLHVVDLDGAKASHIVNTKVLEKICSQTSLSVDFGGGVKTDNDLEVAFSCGAAQITAGSIAAKSPEIVERWIEKYGPEKIILGADVKGELIAINGWKEETDKNVFEFVEGFAQKGIRSVISTDIATDGMLQGPSFELYKRMIEKFPVLDLIASGGVADISDLRALSELGLGGVIIGKAIYENKITLKELSEYVG